MANEIDLTKLKATVGKKVFVVSLLHNVLRTSEHGKLEEVNELNNIVIEIRAMGHSIIPLDEILKVYDEQGYIVYDAETNKEKRK